MKEGIKTAAKMFALGAIYMIGCQTGQWIWYEYLEDKFDGFKEKHSKD